MEVKLNPGGGMPGFALWFLARINRMFEHDTPYWRHAIFGVWSVCAGMLVADSLGVPTGFGPAFDMLLILLLGTIGMGISALAVAFILSLLYVPLPRLFAGTVIFTGLVVYFSFSYANAGAAVSAAIAAVLTCGGVLLGTLAGLLVHMRISASMIIGTAAAVCAAFIGFAYMQNYNPAAQMAFDDSGAAAEEVSPLNAPDPSVPGAYKFRTFTYGSGTDKHRPEFMGEASVISQPVDASAYIKHWPGLRSLFWGFDQKALPLNGRVWMPEGVGAFPLVLIVHGNHLMEQFSDEGYAYLGELLASRGFIAVSVDENFLNYSVWGDIPDQDMKARAWVLLQHVSQIAAFAQKPGNPFYGRVDLKSVALVGHSRGGQAAAMAADRNRWFQSDKTLDSLDDIRIQAVVAMAPTDKTVDKTSARLRDTYYLTIQGASDGDVNTFNGERQYIRTTFGSGSDMFKAAVYIGEANHSRFNTEWGSLDDSLPGGLLLRRGGMMPAESQRQIAKVYIAAFLEAALHGKREYIGLFRDYRAGAAWLPQATYINRYEDGGFFEFARFDDDANKTTFRSGITADASGLIWSEQQAEDRDRADKGTRGAVLQLEDGGSGSFTLKLPRLLYGRAESLVFSMANMERDIAAEGDALSELPPPQVEIELESRNGAVTRLPLSEFMPVVRPPVTAFTLLPWLETRIKDGKYNNASEPVFQTYLLPVNKFRAVNPGFDPSALSRVTFRFSSGPGKLMLDDIGIEQASD